jgi:hypothetical protein
MFTLTNVLVLIGAYLFMVVAFIGVLLFWGVGSFAVCYFETRSIKIAWNDELLPMLKHLHGAFVWPLVMLGGLGEFLSDLEHHHTRTERLKHKRDFVRDRHNTIP